MITIGGGEDSQSAQPLAPPPLRLPPSRSVGLELASINSPEVNTNASCVRSSHQRLQDHSPVERSARPPLLGKYNIRHARILSSATATNTTLKAIKPAVYERHL
ncbi:hypothetical protein NDU88_007127 [Pleurodeles waltl]|uniref:Uncharacterized protein n=1 Tax=Pleurodeles waltl TaxID=8319 RepID=A0AAV7SRM8_PLEWA|nr:hypothetical protein NDU88_007127 [Pleurodeles waltl]